MTCGDCTLFASARTLKLNRWHPPFDETWSHQCGKFGSFKIDRGSPACTWGRSRARANSGKLSFKEKGD